MRWALLTGLAVLVVANLARVPGRPNVVLDGWLFHLVIGLSAALTAARPLLRRGDQLPWSLVAAGMFSWLIGDLCWQFTIQPLGRDAPSPNVSDWWYLLFYPCVVAALLLLARRPCGDVREALWLDGLVAGLGIAAVAALTFDAISGKAGPGMTVLVDLAYPVVDLVLLALTFAVLAARGWSLTPLWLFLGAGYVSMVMADTAFLLKEAAGTYVQGTIWDVGWPIAFVLIALAAWQPGAPQRPVGTGQPALVVPTVVTAVSAGGPPPPAGRPGPPGRGGAAGGPPPRGGAAGRAGPPRHPATRRRAGRAGPPRGRGPHRAGRPGAALPGRVTSSGPDRRADRTGQPA